MVEKSRIGIVGCGDHQRRALMPQLAAVEQAELVACADIDEVAAVTASNQFGFQRPYLDYREMLDGEELDGVMITTPHHLLKSTAIDAIESGCNVFIEKPMGVNVQEALEIRAAAHRAGVSVMVGYCLRFAEGRRIMKSLIESGAIGTITAINAGKGTAPLDGWRTEVDKGGGVLLWLGVHITDQVLWMAESEATRVYGEVYRHTDDGVDQNSTFTINFSNDVSASVTCSQNVGGGVGFDYIEVMGTAGRIKSEWPSNIINVVSETVEEYRHPTLIVPPEPRGYVEKMYRDELDSWVRSVNQRTDPPITVDDGVNVLEVISAVFESGKSNLPVTLR